jgi:hypothetical protein
MKPTTPPPGGRVVHPPTRGDLEPFYKFADVGEVLEGYLAGTKEIKGAPRYRLEDFNGVTWILPGHYKLMELLGQIDEGVRVWIQYDGEQPIEGRPQPMKRYTVHAFDQDQDAHASSGEEPAVAGARDEPGDADEAF